MLRPNNVMIEDRVELEKIPLSALSKRTIDALSNKLNAKKILPSEDGYQRDYRGLASLSGLNWSEYGSVIEQSHDPTDKILKLWMKDQKTANLDQLQQVLGLIERWDVLDDTNFLLVEDAQKYLSDVASGTYNDKTVELNQKSELEVLTRDDFKRIAKGLSPQNYDGFVLFADADIDFATELVIKMEGSGYKLCLKERDLLAGVSFEHETILRLISERCNRLIVIVSPEFLESSANTFFINYAQALGIEQGRRKILPCIIKNCPALPQTIRFLHSLNYMRSGKLWNFWEKLHDSLRTAPGESLSISEEARISELTASFEAQNAKEVVSMRTFLPAITESNKENKISNSPLTPSKSKTLFSFKNHKPEEPEEGIINKSAPLRSQSSSMWNLSTLDNGVSTYNLSMSLDSTVMSTSQILSEPSKKDKWYSKFIPASKKEKPEKKEKESKKKDKWYKKNKKIAVLAE